MKIALTLSIVCLAAMFCMSANASDIRGFLTTGLWYPRDPVALERLLDDCFRGVQPVIDAGRVRGLVVPHAGLAYSGIVAARGFVHLRGRRDIRRVILLGVSHGGGFPGACLSSFSANSTPLGEIPVDRRVISQLARKPGFRVDNRIMQSEHSLENQLPFLQRVLVKGEFALVPILFGRVDPAGVESLAREIKVFVNDHTVVVASSDLTHYGRRFGYLPFKNGIADKLHRLDRGLLERVAALDHKGYAAYLKRTGMTMCGSVPVAVWMRMFSSRDHDLKIVDYRTSGDRNGDYSLSVGYGAVVAAEKTMKSAGLDNAEKTVLLTLARRTLEAALGGGSEASIQNGLVLTPALRRRSGVFVTLRKRRALRGCIGSIVGTRPLYEGVMENARNAAFRDPRFPRLSTGELPAVTIEISVMTPLEKIADYRSIRLGVDGVVIAMEGASAVYLPQVATETGWDLDTFLASLCRKAGLSPRAYRSRDMEFRIFQAQVFSEGAH